MLSRQTDRIISLCNRAGLELEESWLQRYPFVVENAAQATIQQQSNIALDSEPTTIDVYCGSTLQPYISFFEGYVIHTSNGDESLGAPIQVFVDGAVGYVEIDGNVIVNRLDGIELPKDLIKILKNCPSLRHQSSSLTKNGDYITFLLRCFRKQLPVDSTPLVIYCGSREAVRQDSASQIVSDDELLPENLRVIRTSFIEPRLLKSIVNVIYGHSIVYSNRFGIIDRDELDIHSAKPPDLLAIDLYHEPLRKC